MQARYVIQRREHAGNLHNVYQFYAVWDTRAKCTVAVYESKRQAEFAMNIRNTEYEVVA